MLRYGFDYEVQFLHYSEPGLKKYLTDRLRCAIPSTMQRVSHSYVSGARESESENISGRPEKAETELGAAFDSFDPRHTWAAVLKRAISDVRGQNLCLNVSGRLVPSQAKRVRCEALIWLQDDSEEIGSFRWVCGVLGLEPGCVLNLAHVNPKSYKPSAAIA